MAETFDRLTVRTPVAIADMSVELFFPEPDTGGTAGATYGVQVRYSDGTRHVLTGNLVPYLTAGEIDALLNFMADLRERAINEILPE